MEILRVRGRRAARGASPWHESLAGPSRAGPGQASNRLNDVSPSARRLLPAPVTDPPSLPAPWSGPDPPLVSPLPYSKKKQALLTLLDRRSPIADRWKMKCRSFVFAFSPALNENQKQLKQQYLNNTKKREDKNKNKAQKLQEANTALSARFNELPTGRQHAHSVHICESTWLWFSRPDGFFILIPHP